MSLNKAHLLEMDVEKLFEERSIDYIIEIERLIDEEIERKRGELRLMVGDRYKDVLAASDAIKSMKNTSENIVCKIERISQSCEELITKPCSINSKCQNLIPKTSVDERTLLIQLRLTIFLNEQIWIMLDAENNLDAAQYYLLAQHIHTGLSLLKQEELRKIPILNQIKNTLKFLRSKIFQKITHKLESVEITPEDTSKNLNALMLLENQTSIDLLNVFIKHRQIALQTVINMDYSSVRAQIFSMVRCLLTTVTLLHKCFLENNNGERGLIWNHVKELSEEVNYTTLSKMDLPVTPLIVYIPEILKTFRPRYKTNTKENYIMNVESVMKNWLETTHRNLIENLQKLLHLITSVRGLHLSKEESLKIELPENWEQICSESCFPTNFDIWNYFFQQLFTERCKSLISQKISTINDEISKYVNDMLQDISSNSNPEKKLKKTIWIEDSKDIIKENNTCKGLSIKTKGFSEVVVHLCIQLDKKYIELLEDVSQYLYGKEYNSEINYSLIWKDFKFKRKHTDTVEIENHLSIEAIKSALQLPVFIESLFKGEVDSMVTKSVTCARFLQSALQLCPSFHKCCNFNKSTEDWIQICDSFNRSSYSLWRNWLEDVKKGTERHCADLSDLSPRRIIQMIMRWDEIEIQEQTEEKVFTSQIKVPLKLSLGLHTILHYLNDSLSQILPFTLPKTIHVQFIEENVSIILNHYTTLLNENFCQKQAIQFLFDLRFLTTFCMPRENVQLISCSQEICDNLRSRIDPFDLDVFYSYIQNNVKRAVAQSQLFFGCLVPSSTQFANLGLPTEKTKDLDKKPSIMALSTPSTSSWFPLLPISLPVHKPSSVSASKKNIKDTSQKQKPAPKKVQDPGRFMKQSASSFFGGLNTDWFS